MIDISILNKLTYNHTEFTFTKSIFNPIDNIPLHQGMKNYFFPYYQSKTGYCWLESTLQCISLYTKKKTGKSFFFDDKYLMFFDKLEKTNLFFENIICELNKKATDRHNSYILHNAMTDKGQWQMAENLIKKYGLLLKEDVYDISVEKTTELNIYLSYLLRIGAFEIHQKFATNNDISAVYHIKNSVLQNVFDVLIGYYGNQYEKYHFLTYDTLKPSEFYTKKIMFPFDDYISIYPTEDNEMLEKEMNYDGNVYEFDRNKFLGVSNKMFEELVEKQLEHDGFCWCSGDFGKFYIKKAKTLDDSYIKYDSDAFKFMKIKNIKRTTALEYHLANLTHAFVLCKDGTDYYAYDSAFDSNKGAVCWISRSWIDKYLLQAVVSKKYIRNLDKVRRVQEYPWDFFGM